MTGKRVGKPHGRGQSSAATVCELVCDAHAGASVHRPWSCTAVLTVVALIGREGEADKTTTVDSPSLHTAALPPTCQPTSDRRFQWQLPCHCPWSTMKQPGE